MAEIPPDGHFYPVAMMRALTVPVQQPVHHPAGSGCKQWRALDTETPPKREEGLQGKNPDVNY